MDFLEQLGLRYSLPAKLYLLGGSALLLLGSPRETFDVDYLFVVDEERQQSFRQTLDTLANDLKLDLEWVPLDEFIPLPSVRIVSGFWGNLARLMSIFSICTASR
jgi:hypothetical protein